MAKQIIAAIGGLATTGSIHAGLLWVVTHLAGFGDTFTLRGCAAIGFGWVLFRAFDVAIFRRVNDQPSAALRGRPTALADTFSRRDWR